MYCISYADLICTSDVAFYRRNKTSASNTNTSTNSNSNNNSNSNSNSNTAALSTNSNDNSATQTSGNNNDNKTTNDDDIEMGESNTSAAAGTGLESDAKADDLSMTNTNFNFTKDIEGFDIDAVYKLHGDVMIGFDIQHDDYVIHHIKYGDTSVSIGYHKENSPAQTQADKKQVDWLIAHVESLISESKNIDINKVFEAYETSITNPITPPRTSTTAAAAATDTSPSTTSAITIDTSPSGTSTTTSPSANATMASNTHAASAGRSDSRESGEITGDSVTDTTQKQKSKGANDSEYRNNVLKIQAMNREEILDKFLAVEDWDMYQLVRHEMYFYNADTKFQQLMKEHGELEGRQYEWHNISEARMNRVDCVAVCDYAEYSNHAHGPVAKYMQKVWDVKSLHYIERESDIVKGYHKALSCLNRLMLQDAMDRYYTGVFKERLDIHNTPTKRYSKQSMSTYVKKKFNSASIREAMIRQLEIEKSRQAKGWIHHGCLLNVCARDDHGMQLCDGLPIAEWVDKLLDTLKRMHYEVLDEVCRYVIFTVFELFAFIFCVLRYDD